MLHCNEEFPMGIRSKQGRFQIEPLEARNAPSTAGIMIASVGPGAPSQSERAVICLEEHLNATGHVNLDNYAARPFEKGE